MNWTGGRLQQSKRSKRGDLTSEQKAYFNRAKARRTQRLIGHQSDNDQDLDGALDNNNNGPFGRRSAPGFKHGISKHKISCALPNHRSTSKQFGVSKELSSKRADRPPDQPNQGRSLESELHTPPWLEKARLTLLRQPRWLDLGDRTDSRHRIAGALVDEAAVRRRKEPRSNPRLPAHSSPGPYQSAPDDTSVNGNNHSKTDRRGRAHAERQRLNVSDTADLDHDASTSSSSSSSECEPSMHATFAARHPVEDGEYTSQHYRTQDNHSLDNAEGQQHRTRGNVARTDSKISRAQRHTSQPSQVTSQPSPNRAIDSRQQTPGRRIGKHGSFAGHRCPRWAEGLS